MLVTLSSLPGRTPLREVTHWLFQMSCQVLIATSTLAWGVNFPAHLVVVKGTEYFDGKTQRYVDYPITDVLQMMGRAGRPQYDDRGVAVILVHDVKKHFYKKFLYEPFPVESKWVTLWLVSCVVFSSLYFGHTKLILCFTDPAGSFFFFNVKMQLICTRNPVLTSLVPSTH